VHHLPPTKDAKIGNDSLAKGSIGDGILHGHASDLVATVKEGDHDIGAQEAKEDVGG
jgi:hypothetical protein